MKIGFNGRVFQTNEIRGISRYTLKLLNELYRIAPDFEFHVFGNRPIHKTFLDELPFCKVHVHECRSKFLWNRSVLPTMLKKSGVQLYHSTNNIDVPKIESLPLVLTIHDDITHRHRTRSRGVLSWDYWSYWLELQMIQKCDTYITVSQFAKSQMIRSMRIDPSRVQVIYNGADLVSGASVEKRREDFYLYVGGTDPRKNFICLLDALEALGVPTRLVAVSKIDPNNSELTTRIENLKFIKLEVLENISDAVLCDLYAAAKVLVCPSLEEGFGLPLAEAMRLQTPVVVSDIPIFKEISGNFAHFFDPGDHMSLTRLLLELERQPAQRTRFVESAFDFSSKYDWSKSAAEMLKIYKRLVGSKN